MNWYNMLLFIVGTFASVYFGLHSVVWGKAKIPKRNAFRSNKLDTISNAPVLALHSTVLCRSNVGSIFSLHWILSLLLAHRILVIGSYMLSLVVSGWFSPILWQASKIQDPLESAMTYSVILAGFLAISSTKLIYGVILPRDCLTVDCLIYWLKSTGLIVKAYIVTSIMGLFFQTGVYSMVHLLPEQNFTGHSNWLKNDIGLISINILSGMLGYFVLCWICSWVISAVIFVIIFLVSSVSSLSRGIKLIYCMINWLLGKLGKTQRTIMKFAGVIILWNIKPISFFFMTCFRAVLLFVSDERGRYALRRQAEKLEADSDSSHRPFIISDTSDRAAAATAVTIEKSATIATNDTMTKSGNRKPIGKPRLSCTCEKHSAMPSTHCCLYCRNYI